MRGFRRLALALVMVAGCDAEQSARSDGSAGDGGVAADGSAPDGQAREDAGPVSDGASDGRVDEDASRDSGADARGGDAVAPGDGAVDGGRDAAPDAVPPDSGGAGDARPADATTDGSPSDANILDAVPRDSGTPPDAAPPDSDPPPADARSRDSDPPADAVPVDSGAPPDAVPPDADTPPDACVPRRFYADTDGDGLGDSSDFLDTCERPAGYVDAGGDPEPACRTDDTDLCGVCAGPGPSPWYADLDGDGLGDPTTRSEHCGRPDGHVDNGDDLEPACATNDTDACGVCAGPGVVPWYRDSDGDGLGDPADAQPACVRPDGFVANADDLQPGCPTNDCQCPDGTDPDCAGVCDGLAAPDRCGLCAGGTTGREPAVADRDGDTFPDVCDQCPARAGARFVVQWTGVAAYDRRVGGPFTFQVVLHENGDVGLYYEVVPLTGARPTVGAQGPAGEGAVQVPVESLQARAAFYFARRGDRLVPVEAPPFEWLDLRHTGAAIELLDDGEAPAALDFAFPLGMAAYADVTIAANGTLGFSAPLPGYDNRQLPDATTGALVAGLWMDLNPTRGGTVHYQRLPAGCPQDCTGQYGGLAIRDRCGACAGGTTGRPPGATIDCNGDCGGEAFEDVCGRCVGGNTGRNPAPPDACPRAPDLLVDRSYLRDTMVLDTIDARDPCLIDEDCVGALGMRKVIRFGTRIANVGNTDLVLGRPGQGDHWEFDACHRHFHFEHYAAYDLYDVAANALLPAGTKMGFAVIDLGVYDPALAPEGCRGYRGDNQGISVGCFDTYSSNIACQWIDVTDVPDGVYDVVVTTNPDHFLTELTYENNAATVRVEIAGDDLRFLD